MLENSSADATQLPTGCQPESLAKPARRRSHKATQPQLLTRRASSTIIRLGQDIASMSAFEAALGQLGLIERNDLATMAARAGEILQFTERRTEGALQFATIGQGRQSQRLGGDSPRPRGGAWRLVRRRGNVKDGSTFPSIARRIPPRGARRDVPVISVGKVVEREKQALPGRGLDREFG